MSEKVSTSSVIEVKSTHTSDAFLDFVYDLLEYAMPKCGFNWIEPTEYTRTTKKIFREGFGDIIILFRNRNLCNFEQISGLFNEMESTEDILLYVARIREDIFKGNLPLMEIIAYCAFLLDVAFVCFQLEDLDLLYNIVDDTVEVFHVYIKPYFTIIGGWFALYRVAKQYVKYVTFKPQSTLEATVVEGDCSFLLDG